LFSASNSIGSGLSSGSCPSGAVKPGKAPYEDQGHGHQPVGFANPLLYRLARSSPPYPPYHDVTVGTNDLYPAGPGYDMVTGLGTPDAWNLPP
jgi:hypothetical protein